jgi:hypothetical protein
MQTSIQESIIDRTSRRSYQTREFTPELIEKINIILFSSAIGPLGTEIGFEIIEKYSDVNKRLKLGTYGFISGSRYFIVGQSIPDKKAFIDYGYLLEKIILECTHLKLGTCWLGGTFDRGEFGQTVSLIEGNIIPAITPVGYPTANRSLGDKVIRLSAGSKMRKDWESIFFAKNPQNPLVPDMLDKTDSIILEMLRLAPSASNLQPWRIVVKNTNEFHFYLHRKPGYGKAFAKVDLQMIDMGIAICHFDLAAIELGKSPDWKILEEPTEFDAWEYIVTAIN